MRYLIDTNIFVYLALDIDNENNTNKTYTHSFRPAPLPIVEEGGTLVFQFAKDKGYKDKAFFTEQRLRLGNAVQASLTDIALALRIL